MGPTWSNLKDSETVQVGTLLKSGAVVTLVVSFKGDQLEAYVVGVARICGGEKVSNN